MNLSVWAEGEEKLLRAITTPMPSDSTVFEMTVEGILALNIKHLDRIVIEGIFMATKEQEDASLLAKVESSIGYEVVLRKIPVRNVGCY